MRSAPSVRQRRGASISENDRADCQVYLIDQSCLKQGVVQLTTSFAEQSLNFPFLTQPYQGAAEVDFTLAADMNVLRASPQVSQAFGAGPFRCQHDDG